MNIERTNWVSSFTLIGEVDLRRTKFLIDERSQKSSWQYSRLNLAVKCGEKSGTIYSEMMGGFDAERQNYIYAHGKSEDGNDDFNEKMQVSWEDRDNESILKDIGNLCFITVGLEKTAKGETFYKKFLSAYDAIEYIKQYLEDGMVINVKGTLNYSTYKGNTQVHKNIKSIVLSKIDDPSKYVARFSQSILLDPDSIESIDKKTGIVNISARVLDYVKEIDGVEIKGQYPMRLNFEYAINTSNPELIKKVINKLFKVRKGVTQINFDGNFILSGSIVSVTEDDMPDDIKELIELNIYTLDDAKTVCAGSGKNVQKMVLVKPIIRMTGSDDNKVPVIQIFENRYEEDDLTIDIPETVSNNEDMKLDELPFGIDDDDDMSWINNL